MVYCKRNRIGYILISPFRGRIPPPNHREMCLYKGLNNWIYINFQTISTLNSISAKYRSLKIWYANSIWSPFICHMRPSFWSNGLRWLIIFMIRLTHIDIGPRKLMYDIYFTSHRFIAKKVISYSCQESVILNVTFFYKYVCTSKNVSLITGR